MKTQVWQMWDELAKPINARIAEFHICIYIYIHENTGVANSGRARKAALRTHR